MLWKPTTPCKLWKLQSRPLDDHPMDRSGGGTIFHVTPPTHPILVYAITNAAAARLVATRRRRASPRGTTPPGSPAAIPGLASRPPPCLVASSRRGSLHHGGRWIRPWRRSRPTWGSDDHHGGWGSSLHRRLGLRRRRRRNVGGGRGSDARTFCFLSRGLLGKQRLRSLMVGGFK